MNYCTRILAALVTTLAFTVTIAGCGGGMESEVSGVVTLDGQPIGPGVVAFVPADAPTNPATGAIQLDGAYFLKSNRTEGLPAGEYRASVSVYKQPDVKPGERSTEAAKLLTPPKYADVNTSGLEYTVEPGENEINIVLSSK